MVGSAEELYHAMENASVDLVINDQWRAFSDTYHNEVLAESKIYKDHSGYYIEAFFQLLRSCF